MQWIAQVTVVARGNLDHNSPVDRTRESMKASSRRGISCTVLSDRQKFRCLAIF